MKSRGFTLAELLIALAILGVIAVFTIPKVLQSQSDGKYKAMAKEAAATISSAYMAYKSNATVSASTKPSDLLPYLNYLRRETTSATTIDQSYGDATAEPCTIPATDGCLRLHNGGVLQLTACGLGGTGNTNAMVFRFDPDGRHDPAPYGPAKTIIFHLYMNGRIRDFGSIEPNTFTSCGGPDNPTPAAVPPWFSW